VSGVRGERRGVSPTCQESGVRDQESTAESLSDIDAVILAGGLGTRLRSVVSDRPKPLSPVAGRPFLAYLLDQLAEAGLRRVTLCTGYRGEMVQAAFGTRYGQLQLSYSQEDHPLGTAGAVLAALGSLAAPTLLVANGDSLCRADLPAFWQFHCAQRAAASLLLSHVNDTCRFGRVELDDHRHVLRFHEKQAVSIAGWINAGLYLIERNVLAEFPASPLSFERDVFPALIRSGSLCGWPGGGEFLDIGTPESFACAESFLHAGCR
jgi:D-glycero-alpha-D-manno-heptose 1-phosphate guanylyltransferase